MSDRLQHLRCDHVNDSDSAQQETFSQCTAGQRAGGGNGLRPKCKVHWHRQPWARAGQRDCNHQLQRSQRRRPQESEAPPSSKRRRVDLCQNRKISRMRWVLGTLVGVHRFISAPMDVGRRPKTIAIEENLWTPLGTRLFNIDRTGTQCSLILTLTQPLLGGRPHSPPAAATLTIFGKAARLAHTYMYTIKYVA